MQTSLKQPTMRVEQKDTIKLNKLKRWWIIYNNNNNNDK